MARTTFIVKLSADSFRFGRSSGLIENPTDWARAGEAGLKLGGTRPERTTG
jgi:hypothetical protein